MKLNLRKARKLETKIKSYVDSNDISYGFRVRIKESPDKVVQSREEARQKLISDITDLEQLIELRYSIRTSIGTANESTGINRLISQRAMLESKYKFFKNDSMSFIGKGVVTDEEIKDTLEFKLNNPSTGYGSDKVTTEFLALKDKDLDTRDGIRKSIKRELEDIDDKLSASNLSTTIELGINQIALLKLHGLV